MAQMNMNLMKEEEEKKKVDGALDTGTEIKPTNPAGNGANSGATSGAPSPTFTKSTQSMISNPANQDDIVLDDGLSSGLTEKKETGDPSATVPIRSTLENKYGVSSGAIGYDGKNVTLGGKVLIEAQDNRDGTTYVKDEKQIADGLSAYIRDNGHVAVRDYATSRGVPTDIKWDDATGMVTINGVSFKPAYIVGGKAYMPQSQLDEILKTGDKNNGIRSEKDILEQSEGKYGGRRDEAFSEFMDYGDFSYSAKDDQAFQEFMDAYRKGVQEEYDKNMAQARFRTGGVPSSAVMQQAANIREGALEDAAKFRQQYEDRAYQKWQDGLTQAYNEFMAANGMLRDDYTLYSGANDKARNAFMEDKDFDINHHLDLNDLSMSDLETHLSLQYMPGIYADEAAVSEANADTAVRQNALGAAYDEPLMQESYSQAVLGTKAAENNAFWNNLMNQGDFGAAILNAMAQEAKSGVSSGIDWRALLVQAGLLKEE